MFGYIPVALSALSVTASEKYSSFKSGGLKLVEDVLASSRFFDTVLDLSKLISLEVIFFRDSVVKTRYTSALSIPRNIFHSARAAKFLVSICIATCK